MKFTIPIRITKKIGRPWLSIGLGNTLPGYTKYFHNEFAVTSGGNGIGGT
jgi:hypothetical protein